MNSESSGGSPTPIRETAVQTPPAQTTAPNTRPRQRRYLAVGLLLLASAITAFVLLDRSGASRHENRERSNEEQTERGQEHAAPRHEQK